MADDRDRGGATVPPLVAGVELGGTKCIATLASGPDGIVASRTVATTTPVETLPRLRAILDEWVGAAPVAAIGVASFGPIAVDPAMPDHGRIRHTNKPGWTGADVLGALTGGIDLPRAFDTDVNGAALAETRWGVGRGLVDFAYVTVGTGVGVGLIVHGRPTRGIGHGEAGHMRVPRLPNDDGPSGCRFHDDCVEGLASGKGVVAAARGVPLDTLPSDHPIWDRVVAALGAMGYALAATTGPWRIALGGGVIERQPHLLGRVDRAIRDSAAGYLDLPEPYVVAPALGPLAGALGPIAMAQACLAAASR